MAKQIKQLDPVDQQKLKFNKDIEIVFEVGPAKGLSYPELYQLSKLNWGMNTNSTMSQFISDFNQAAQDYFVALALKKNTKQIVGWTLMYIRRKGFDYKDIEAECEIDTWVDEQYRHQRIGAKLMAKAKDFLNRLKTFKNYPIKITNIEVDRKLAPKFYENSKILDPKEQKRYEQNVEKMDEYEQEYKKKLENKNQLDLFSKLNIFLKLLK